jgi:hypothetical protein
VASSWLPEPAPICSWLPRPAPCCFLESVSARGCCGLDCVSRMRFLGYHDVWLREDGNGHQVMKFYVCDETNRAGGLSLQWFCEREHSVFKELSLICCFACRMHFSPSRAHAHTLTHTHTHPHTPTGCTSKPTLRGQHTCQCCFTIALTWCCQVAGFGSI